MILGLAALLTAFGGLILPLFTWLRGGALEWDLSAIGSHATVTGLQPADGVRVSVESGVHVKILDASASAWLASMMPGVIATVSVVIVVLLLGRLVQRIQLGSPFVGESLRALRTIALTMFLGSWTAAFAATVAEKIISAEALTDSFSFTFEAPIALTLAALLVLALAEAFAQGIRLQDDVEGLV